MFLLKYHKILEYLPWRIWFSSVIVLIHCLSHVQPSQSIQSVVHFCVCMFSRQIQMSHFSTERLVHQKVPSKMQKLERLYLLLTAFWISPEFYNWFNNKNNYFYNCNQEICLENQCLIHNFLCSSQKYLWWYPASLDFPWWCSHPTGESP